MTSCKSPCTDPCAQTAAANTGFAHTSNPIRRYCIAHPNIAAVLGVCIQSAPKPPTQPPPPPSASTPATSAATAFSTPLHHSFTYGHHHLSTPSAAAAASPPTAADAAAPPSAPALTQGLAHGASASSPDLRRTASAAAAAATGPPGQPSPLSRCTYASSLPADAGETAAWRRLGDLGDAAGDAAAAAQPSRATNYGNAAAVEEEEGERLDDGRATPSGSQQAAGSSSTVRAVAHILRGIEASPEEGSAVPGAGAGAERAGSSDGGGENDAACLLEPGHVEVEMLGEEEGGRAAAGLPLPPLAGSASASDAVLGALGGRPAGAAAGDAAAVAAALGAGFPAGEGAATAAEGAERWAPPPRPATAPHTPTAAAGSTARLQLLHPQPSLPASPLLADAAAAAAAAVAAAAAAREPPPQPHTLWVVEECFGEESLHCRLERGMLSWQQACRVATDICKALAFLQGLKRHHHNHHSQQHGGAGGGTPPPSAAAAHAFQYRSPGRDDTALRPGASLQQVCVRDPAAFSPRDLCVSQRGWSTRSRLPLTRGAVLVGGLKGGGGMPNLA